VAAPTAAPRRAPLRRPIAPRLPRRVSGPARRRRRARSTVLERLLALPDHRLVDRLVRGRVWIPLIGFLLIGIVAMQVSMRAAGKLGLVMPAPDQVRYLKVKPR
jgi:hypothetical protein